MRLTLRHTPWRASELPTEAGLRRILREQGMEAYTWSNGPFDTYTAHTHAYDKVLYCVSGTIIFRLGGDGQTYELRPGDRLDLPAGTVHAAEVGAQGVVCLEAHLGLLNA